MNIQQEIIQFIFSNSNQFSSNALSYLSIQKRLEELIAKQKYGLLSFEEQAELKYFLVLQSLVRIAKGKQLKLSKIQVSSYT